MCRFDNLKMGFKSAKIKKYHHFQIIKFSNHQIIKKWHIQKK